MHSQKWIRHYIYQPIYLPFMYMLVSYRNKHIIPTLMMLVMSFWVVERGREKGSGREIRRKRERVEHSLRVVI